MKQQFLQTIYLSNSTTYYYHPQCGRSISSSNNYANPTATEEDVEIILGDTGTLQNLRVDIVEGGAPGAGKSWTFTVRKNGADTDLELALSDSETSGTNQSDDVVIAAGDYVSVKVTSSGSPTSGAIASISLEYETTQRGYSMISGGFESYAGTSYAPFATYGILALNSYESNFEAGVSPIDFTIRSLYVNVTTAPGAGKERGVNIRSDYNSLVSLNVTGTDTEASSTGLDVSVSAGDNLNAVLKVDSGPAASILRYSLLIEANIDGESILCPGYGEWHDDDPVFDYPGINHAGCVSAVTTERVAYSGPSGFILKKLYQNSRTLSFADSRTATVRKNGDDTVLECTISGSESSASDTSNTVTYDEGDSVGLKTDNPGITDAENEYGCIYLCQYIPSELVSGLPIRFAG